MTTKSTGRTRKKTPPATRTEEGKGNRTSLYLLIAAVVMALLMNFVFYSTYPLNLAQSDNTTYLTMIVRGTSNLFHASGYPAILRVITMSWYPVDPVVDLQPRLNKSAALFNALQRMQLLLHTALFLTAIFLCLKVFNKAAAILLSIGWGFNLLFMSGVNATAPEWLQADVLILCLLLFAYARKLKRNGKILLYCGASVIFAVAYLIKYNSLLFALPLLVLLVFDEAGWKFKAAQSVACAVIVVALVASYAAFYHSKSTGTRQLTFDHAWVLTASMPRDYLSTPPELLGMNSLRWHALVSVTPVEYFRAVPVWNVDYGPEPAIRTQCSELYDSVFRSSRADLIQYVKAHPLPAAYEPFLAAVPLYYYYGLERIDRLGIEVYKESLQLRWPEYFKRIVSQSGLFVSVPQYHPVPTLKNPLDFTLLPPDSASGNAGEVRIVPPANVLPRSMPYYNPSEVLSSYAGFRMVGWLDAVAASSIPFAAINILAVVGFFRLKSVADRLNVLCLLAGLLMFISASSMLMGMRTKELITVTPIYFCLVSVGLVSAYRWLSEVIARTRKRPA